MNILAIIPARGGSKSIPLKNIKNLLGKPLIAWSIDSALKSKHKIRVVVSTDNEVIREVAIQHGAEAPFLRPQELANDTIGIEPTLKHAYEWYRDNQNYHADIIILLMPTSPSRQAFHIDDAIDIFIEKKADSVVAVNETPANHTPYWTLNRQQSGEVTLWGGIPLKHILTRRQDFPLKCYARNDLVYVLKPDNLYDQEKPNLYGKKVELYIETEPHKYEVDINTPDEWLEAEYKLKKLLE